MFWLLLGTAILACLLLGLRAFERASVESIRALLKWAAALGGIVLTLGLLLSGRGLPALVGLAVAGPALWQRWRESQASGPRGAPGSDRPRPKQRGAGGAMTPAEALEVLGLKPGADAAEIHAAHRRLMRLAHPDAGGSDWLASRINQARDVLLG